MKEECRRRQQAPTTAHIYGDSARLPPNREGYPARGSSSVCTCSSSARVLLDHRRTPDFDRMTDMTQCGPSRNEFIMRHTNKPEHRPPCARVPERVAAGPAHCALRPSTNRQMQLASAERSDSHPAPLGSDSTTPVA